MTTKRHNFRKRKKSGAPEGNQNAAKAEPLDKFLKIRISERELESAKKRHKGKMANNIRQYLREGE